MGFLKRLTILVVGVALVSTIYDLLKDPAEPADTGGIKIIETVTAAVAKEDTSMGTVAARNVGIESEKVERVKEAPVMDQGVAVATDVPQSQIPAVAPSSGLREIYSSSSLSISRSPRLRGHSFLANQNNETCLKYSDCLNGRGHVALAGMQFNLAKADRQVAATGVLHSVDRPALYLER